jgi:hypothetical protein
VFGVEMRVEQKERKGCDRVLPQSLEVRPDLDDLGSCAKGLVDQSFRVPSDPVLYLEPKERQGSSPVLLHNLEVRPDLDNLCSYTKGLAEKGFRDVTDPALCLEPKYRECSSLMLPHNLQVRLGLDNLDLCTKGFAENVVRAASGLALDLEPINAVDMDRSNVKSPQMHLVPMQKRAAAPNAILLKRLLHDHELVVESQSLSPDLEFV